MSQTKRVNNHCFKRYYLIRVNNTENWTSLKRGQLRRAHVDSTTDIMWVEPNLECLTSPDSYTILQELTPKELTK